MVDYVLAGLIKRRALLAGEAREARRRLLEIDAALLHVDATIRLVDPTFDLVSIRPRKARPDPDDHRPRNRLVLDILREAGDWVVTAEVVLRAMAREGLDSRDRPTWRIATKRVSQALGRQRALGRIQSRPGNLQTVQWAIADLPAGTGARTQ